MSDRSNYLVTSDYISIMADFKDQLQRWMTELTLRVTNKAFYEEMQNLIAKRLTTQSELHDALNKQSVQAVDGIEQLAKSALIVATAVTPGAATAIPVVTSVGDIIKNIIAFAASISKYRDALRLSSYQQQQLRHNYNGIKLLKLLDDFRQETPTLSAVPLQHIVPKLVDVVSELLYFRHMFLLESNEFQGHAGDFIQFLGNLITEKVLDDKNCYGTVISKFLRASFPAEPDAPEFLKDGPFIHKYYTGIATEHHMFYYAQIFYNADRIYIFKNSDNVTTYKSCLHTDFRGAPNKYPPIIDFDVDYSNAGNEYLPYSTHSFTKVFEFNKSSSMDKVYSSLGSTVKDVSLLEIFAKINAVLTKCSSKIAQSPAIPEIKIAATPEKETKLVTATEMVFAGPIKPEYQHLAILYTLAKEKEKAALAKAKAKQQESENLCEQMKAVGIKFW